ncbi:TspO/MBR family protein [Kitasatospora indigofera]|uniref:TspO/MBR family protein n=1 Tax=Kitasatospora indigofera TaxID=67307 RepID=UPI001E3165C4|nr:TspO/MBR family protein [Kitasatospora indigofera]
MTASAVIGGWPVDPDSAWYRSLAKPAWQPPSWAFGAVWTPLYASIAWAGARALLAAQPRDRRALATSLGVNLSLNTAWNWVFFHYRSPTAALAGTALLDISNADLIRRTTTIDPVAGAALTPYAAWCAFATALNADIARHNRR